MGVGPKIKELRTKAGMTQKELADELFVTYQAVSRWENGDAEPSIDTLKEICRILNCSIEELFEMEKKEEKPVEVQEKVVERVIIQQAPPQKPVLGVCEKCNRPIYDGKKLHRVQESITVRTGRTSHQESRTTVLCDDCHKKKVEADKKIAEQKRREMIARFRKKRIHSFIWPILVAAIGIAWGITELSNGNKSEVGVQFIVLGVLCFFFVADMILNNTFIPKMWHAVNDFFFVKCPGLIITFDLDGLKFLIAMKLLFFVLNGIAMVVGFFVSCAVAMVFSPFAYPFALYKNIKCKDENGYFD